MRGRDHGAVEHLSTYTAISIAVRITGGALLIAGELIDPPNEGLLTAASVLESAGLAPLLLATIGFLGLV